jgi:hypothetical protein
MMEFLCPSGHRIRCPSDQAGRAAKCPRCGVKFRIPQPTDDEVSAIGSSDSNFSQPELIESTGSSRKLPVGGAGVKKEPQIEFLCPNGHVLHGAASLQGRPGECPECHSRFRIPTYEDVAPEENAEQAISVGRADATGSDVRKRDAGVVPAAAPPENPGHAMESLVSKLWDIRPNGAKIELRLRDGEILLPEQYLKTISHKNHQGVFAVREENGSLSLAVVAWDTVARATLRGLSELPKGLAE